jgi:hypothetical protein
MKKVPWSETLSEWFACAGLGLIPLFVSGAVAALTGEGFIFRLSFLSRELILFCIVTNAASIVVFVSKFNLLQITNPKGRTIPTSLIFAVLIVALACGIVLVALDVHPESSGLYHMLSCVVTTLIFSLWAERKIGVLARE